MILILRFLFRHALKAFDALLEDIADKDFSDDESTKEEDKHVWRDLV